VGGVDSDIVHLSSNRHLIPPVVIQQAIWLYHRFTLSYRDLGLFLPERGRLDPSIIVVTRPPQGVPITIAAKRRKLPGIFEFSAVGIK
jgi:hypothetical protein